MELLTVEEAASRLRLSPRSVYRMLERGSLEGTRVGGSWRIPVSSLPNTAQRETPVLTPSLRGRINAAVDELLRRVREDRFSRYFTEADLTADLATALRVVVPPEEGEVLIDLSVAGATSREIPDLSIIPPQQPWAERRGVPALYSAEFKYFSYRGTTGAYRLSNRWFRDLLAAMASRFDRIAERRRAGLLGGGALIWVDAFDWLERCKPAERESVVAERADWFRRQFTRPGSEIRAEYVPIRYPDYSVSLNNDFHGTGPLPTTGGSLFGAARPLMRRTPPPEEEWDDLVEKSIAADYLATERD